MRFSTTASLTAGALLLGAGMLTMRKARGWRERQFAAIPLLFAATTPAKGPSP